MGVATQPVEVAATFASYDEPVRAKLLELRQLIFETAAETDGVGEIEEALRWGQPSYLTSVSRSGSTVRLAPTAAGSDFDCAVFFICNTNLVDSFRDLFGDTLSYDANRAIQFCADDVVPVDEVRQCIAMALTYHVK